MSDTEAAYARIEALCDKATPGPWYVWQVKDEPERVDGTGVTARESWAIDAPRKIVETDSGYYPPRWNDAQFIARARTDMPWLIARCRELEAELAQRS